MSDWPRTIGVMGCGAMGRAMAVGLIRDRPDLAPGLVLVDAVAEAAEDAATETGGRTGQVGDLAGCDVIVLAVKPKDAEVALTEIGSRLAGDTVVLSVVAGWGIDRIRALVPAAGIARTMPNLAVRHGAGLVAIATRDIAPAAQPAFTALLDPLGAVIEMPEHLIGPATALVGSGPGFIALVAEGLEDGAVAIGFPRSQARSMVQAVLAGSAALLADGTDPADLRQRVSSPAGTTIEGIGVLERGSVRAHVADAVRAAARRASEL
jgi:pyrroline-5-carboxylate reductase